MLCKFSPKSNQLYKKITVVSELLLGLHTFKGQYESFHSKTFKSKGFATLLEKDCYAAKQSHIVDSETQVIKQSKRIKYIQFITVKI